MGHVARMLACGGCFLTIVTCVTPAAEAAPPSLGSYTFNWTGAAPVGASITIKGLFKQVTNQGVFERNISVPLNISGLTGAQAANNFLTLLKADNVTAELNGGNSINVFSLKDAGEVFTIAKVDQSASKAGFNATLDGNVQIALLAPNPRWDVSFDPATVATSAGSLDLTVPGFGPLTTLLASGATADDATLALYTLLNANSFPDVQCLDSSGNPETGCTNSTDLTFFLDPSSSPVSAVTALSFDGANLEYALGLPAEVCEPATITTLILACLVLSWLHGVRVASGPA